MVERAHRGIHRLSIVSINIPKALLRWVTNSKRDLERCWYSLLLNWMSCVGVELFNHPYICANHRLKSIFYCVQPNILTAGQENLPVLASSRAHLRH